MACGIKTAGKSWGETVDKVFDSIAAKASRMDETATKALGNSTGRHLRNILFVHEADKIFSDVLRDFRIAKNQIYENAATVRDSLASLPKEQSESLVRALNGDIDKATLDENGQKLYEKMRMAIDGNADTLIELGALGEKNKIKDYLKRYYTQHLETKTGLEKLYFNKKFKARKDLTHDERIALGMVEDASFVIPQTLAEQRTQILKATMLKKLSDRFGVDEMQDGYMLVPDETVGGGVYRYGALAGRYVPKEIYGGLIDAGVLKHGMSELEQSWYALIDHIKVNVTVKNPATHLYNVGSNFVMAYLHGDISALVRFISMGKEKKAQIVAEARKHGLNSALTDFEGATVFGENRRPNLMLTILKNAYMAKGSKLGDAMRRAYAWEDELFKVAAFDKNMRERTAELGRALTDEEKAQAFKDASEAYVDYETPLPDMVRKLDKGGVFPFLHYTWKATPVVAKTMAKNPLRALSLLAGLGMLGASSIFNEDDDAIRPTWAADQFNLLGAKEWVNLHNGWFFNAGRLVPGVKLGHIDFSGGFVGGIFDILQGETPLGFTIGSKYDTKLQTIAKRGAALAENYAPSISPIGRYGQRTAQTLAGEPKKNSSTGEKMGIGEVYSQAAGFRKFDGTKEAQSKANALKNKYKHEVKDGEPEAAARMEYNRDTADLQGEAMRSGAYIELPSLDKKPRGGLGVRPRINIFED